MNEVANAYMSTFLQALLFMAAVYAVSFLAWWKFAPQKRQRIKVVMIVVGVLFLLIGAIGAYTVMQLNSLGL